MDSKMPINPITTKEKDSLTMIYDFSKEKTLSDTQSDIWDELNNTSRANFFFYPISKQEAKIRLLGPHYNAQRIYIPTSLELEKLISTEDFKNLISGDNAVKLKLLQKLQDSPKNSFKSRGSFNNISSADIDTINKISNMDSWQPCLLINAYVYDINKIQIVTFTSSMLQSLEDSIKKDCTSQNKNINGLLAHDILITSRRDNQFDTNMFGTNQKIKAADISLNICKEASLFPKEYINYIIKNGLLDIPKVIKYSNKTQANKMNGYFYAIKDLNFKAPEEFSRCIINDAKKVQQKQNIKKMLTYDTENLPSEALEDRDDYGNPIANMEIE